MTILRNFLLLSVSFFIVTGCNKGGEHLPAAKMEQIMFDLGIAESYSTKGRDNNNFGGVKNMDSLAAYYKEIMAHHNVTAEQFSQSLTWYKARPDEIDSIYTHLAARADKVNIEESKKRKLGQ